jgi:hypothetical protein
MIEKLILEFPTHVDNCQEKKAALQQQAGAAAGLIEVETLKKRIPACHA